MKFGLPAIKLASIDLNYFQLQNKLLKFKLPIIFSTGMGTEKEIIQSVNFFKKNKKSDIALLHCNSYYPPKNNMVNLNNIKHFEKKFKMIVGYSDHTEDNYTAFASVVLGAKIIEKHITLDKKYKIIKKNLSRYSSNFLKKIGLKYIVLCEDLSIAKINTAGIPNNITRTLILDIKFNETYFERAIHHEVFHIIKDNYKKFFEEVEWKNFNKKEFEYSKCSTCNNKWNLHTYNKTNGFLTEYSKSTASEDMAEVFSHLMFYQDKIYTDDPIIKKKIKFIMENISRIDNSFKF